MQTAIVGLIVFCGVSFAFWGGVGLLRLTAEKLGDGEGGGRGLLKGRGGLFVGVFIGAAGALAFWLVLALMRVLMTSLTGGLPSASLLIGAGLFLLALWLALGWLGARVVSGRLVDRPELLSRAIVAQALTHVGGVLVIAVPAALAAGFTLAAFGVGIIALLFLTLSIVGIGMRFPCWSQHRPSGELLSEALPITADDIAVVIPAHNEESVLPLCLEALGRILPMSNVHVGNDGSTDRTAAIAESAGCRIVTMRLNKGKAFTIQRVLDEERICERYRAVMILDADSEVDPHYLERALPLLNLPSTAAVAGHVLTKWRSHLLPRWSMFFVAYRLRLYLVLQAVLRYGQTWAPTNVHYIVPGFASIYRTEVLEQIDVAAEGLIIEDFNMTFELHRKRLGKIAYSPSVRCISQDPAGFKDYFRQLKRWNLGFWQTVRRNGFWPSLFWASLSVFILELMIFSAFMLTLPFQLLYFGLGDFSITAPSLPLTGGGALTVNDLIVGIILIDYGLTIIAAIIARKPVLLLYGIGFFAIRFIDAFLLLYTFALSYVVKSDGRWTSPART